MPARLLLPLFLAALLESGCATILHGSHQDVRVFSDPPAARVEVDGAQAGETPINVRLRRGKTHVLQVSKAGYEERTLSLDSSIKFGWIVLDVLCAGLIGVVVDGATSNWESFEHSLSLHLVNLGQEAVPVVAVPAPAAPASGVLLMVDRQLSAFPGGTGTVYAKIKIGWHVKEVDLSFGDGLHVGSNALGPYQKDRIVLHKGSEAHVQAPDGRVVHLRVKSLDPESVEIAWIDRSGEAKPQEAIPAGMVSVASPAPAATPVRVDTTAALGGMLQLRDDRPVEFPVDGGVISAKIHRDDIELRLGDGLHVGYTAGGPFSADRITLVPGMDAYVLTRANRVVHVRCSSLEAGEAMLDWRRK